MAEVETIHASELRYVHLAAADASSVFALHLAATKAVARPDLIKPESPDFFHRILGGEGHIIGALQGDSLVGYGVLQIDLPPSEDARPLLKLAPVDRLAKLAGASVLPGAWGGGLHDALIGLRVAEARRAGIEHLYSTAAPGNERSWTNLLDAGFAVRGLIEKYGGHLRYLLHLDLSKADDAPGEGHWCGVDDIARQQALIADGLAGTRWRRREDGGRDLWYQKPS